MKIKKLGWIRRWFYNNTHRLIGLKCGPVMLNFRGEYLYIDPWGTKWRVIPTGQPDMPLEIQVLERQ